VITDASPLGSGADTLDIAGAGAEDAAHFVNASMHILRRACALFYKMSFEQFS